MSLLLSKSLSYLALSLYVFQYDYDNDYSLYGIALCYPVRSFPPVLLPLLLLLLRITVFIVI